MAPVQGVQLGVSFYLFLSVFLVSFHAFVLGVCGGGLRLSVPLFVPGASFIAI